MSATFTGLKSFNGGVIRVEPKETIAREGPLKSNENSMHRAMAPVLVVAQCFALFPVQNVTSHYAQDLRFTWRSLRILFLFLALITISIPFCFSSHAFGMAGYTFESSRDFVFHLVTLSCWVLFFRLARGWPRFVLMWERLEHSQIRYGYPKHLRWKIGLVTTIILSLELVEHFLAECNTWVKAGRCSTDILTRIILTVILGRMEIFSITGYRLPVLIYVPAITYFTVFYWSFGDLFLITISIALSSRFRLLNQHLKKSVGKDMSESYWRKAREDYNDLSLLTKALDSRISCIILLCFGSNLYFICKQLFYSMKSTMTVMEMIYFSASFGFLLGRAIAMNLYVSSVYEESTAAKHILYAVPQRNFNVEVHRFLVQISTDNIALTGLKFFSVTRTLLLTLAGTILTYEVVLVQFQTPTEPTPQNLTYTCWNFTTQSWCAACSFMKITTLKGLLSEHKLEAVAEFPLYFLGQFQTWPEDIHTCKMLCRILILVNALVVSAYVDPGCIFLPSDKHNFGICGSDLRVYKTRLDFKIYRCLYEHDIEELPLYMCAPRRHRLQGSDASDEGSLISFRLLGGEPLGNERVSKNRANSAGYRTGPRPYTPRYHDHYQYRGSPNNYYRKGLRDVIRNRPYVPSRARSVLPHPLPAEFNLDPGHHALYQHSHPQTSRHFPNYLSDDIFSPFKGQRRVSGFLPHADFDLPSSVLKHGGEHALETDHSNNTDTPTKKDCDEDSDDASSSKKEPKTGRKVTEPVSKHNGKPKGKPKQKTNGHKKVGKKNSSTKPTTNDPNAIGAGEIENLTVQERAGLPSKEDTMKTSTVEQKVADIIKSAQKKDNKKKDDKFSKSNNKSGEVTERIGTSDRAQSSDGKTEKEIESVERITDKPNEVNEESKNEAEPTEKITTSSS